MIFLKKAPDYRLYVISRVPNLRVLDFSKVSQKEREQAKAKFDFMPEKQRMEEEESKISKDKKEKIRVTLSPFLDCISIYIYTSR